MAKVKEKHKHVWHLYSQRNLFSNKVEFICDCGLTKEVITRY